MHNLQILLFFSSVLYINFAYEEIEELCDGWNQMKCWSIGCVQIADKCDGKRDCADGSDETKSLCKSMVCTDEEFKCDYGACVPGKSKCNGTTECWDGSDERKENCVEIIARPILTLDAKNTYTLGSSIAMKCSVKRTLKPAIAWTKDKIPLLANERLQITTEPHTLVLHNVTMDDAGNYSCIANISGINFASEERVDIGPNNQDCIDNKFFANCQLIVKANFCHHLYYQKFCCKSCSQKDELPEQYTEPQVAPAKDSVLTL